jgi:DNA-binding HxlR family transcriptional regulator
MPLKKIDLVDLNKPEAEITVCLLKKPLSKISEIREDIKENVEINSRTILKRLKSLEAYGLVKFHGPICHDVFSQGSARGYRIQYELTDYGKIIAEMIENWGHEWYSGLEEDHVFVNL